MGQIDHLVDAGWLIDDQGPGHRVIAIDGKTTRGARTRTTRAGHLISALDHASGAVVG